MGLRVGNAKQTPSQWISHIDHRDFADWAEARLDAGEGKFAQKHRHVLDAADEVLVTAVQEFIGPEHGEGLRGAGRGLKQRDGHVWLTPRFLKEKFPTLGLGEQAIRKRMRWLVEIGLLDEFHTPHGRCDGSRFRKGVPGGEEGEGGQRSFYGLSPMVMKKKQWREEHQLLREQGASATVLEAHLETKPRYPGEIALERWRVSRDRFLQSIRERGGSEAERNKAVREWYERYPKPGVPSSIDHRAAWEAALQGEVVGNSEGSITGDASKEESTGDSQTVSGYQLGNDIVKIEKIEPGQRELVDNSISQTVSLYHPKRYNDTSPNGIMIPPRLFLGHTLSRCYTSSRDQQLVDNSPAENSPRSPAPATAARSARPPAAGAQKAPEEKDAEWFRRRREVLNEQARLVAQVGDGSGSGGEQARRESLLDARKESQPIGSYGLSGSGS